MADPLGINDQAIWANVRRADTLDLLNRVTAFRAGMEPEAITIIEAELLSRQYGPEEIGAHAQSLGDELVFLEDGCAARCSFCRLPAVAQGWGWHHLWGLVPVFPRYFYYCKVHR